MRRVISESKKNLHFAIVKCLTGAKLNPNELHEICATTQADLMRDHGCDMYMAEQIMLHAKKELFRLRAQNLYTRFESEDFDGGYPKKPYTRTAYIKESRKRLFEDHHEEDRHSHSSGRMLDYGHNKSDSEEGRMMKQSLRDLAVDAYRLHQMLEDGDDLPQWCQYKTAQAQQMVGSVRNYLEYKLERMSDDLVGEKEMFDPEEMAEDFGEESTEEAMEHWGDAGEGDEASFQVDYMAGTGPSSEFDYDMNDDSGSEYQEYDEDLEDEDFEDEDLENEDFEDEDFEDEDPEMSDETDDGYDGSEK